MLLSLAAALGMAIGAPPATAGLAVPICGDSSHVIHIPMKDDGRRRDCPAGCHAMCARRDMDCDGE